ncbi:MAG: 2-hydroxymuconate tautomerase family protein [Methylocystaceae bacterium]|nr:2-hydroxymuconate tautomerase family protein [Methylocystaceae bacterium]
MPLAQITILEGRSEEKKKKLIEDVSIAISESIGAPIETVRVLVQEIPPAHWGVGGKPKG